MDSAPKLPNPTKTEDKAINMYLEVETEYMAAAGFYTDSGNAHIRSHAVSIIARHSPNVDPDDAFIPYLAMNYFDRYFSTNQFQDVQDVRSDSEKVCLIALCCLFISAKMRTETFSIDRFMRVKYVNFTHERIIEMEINILGVLNWRMQPVTAFVYLNHYYRLFKSLGRFKRRWINEIIVQAQGENEFVCYKPSQIAMSAFIAAAKIAYPSEYNKHHYQEEEEELSECVRALGDLCVRKNIKIEPLHDELIATLTDEIGNKTHPEEGSLEAGTTKGEAKKLTHDEVIAILTDEIGEGWKPRKGGIVREVKKPSHAEIIAILTDEIGNKTHPEEQKASEDEIVEIDEEEKRKLAKGKAVAVSETSNEEKRRLAKGKTVALYSEIFDEERQRQPPKSISEEEKKKLDKEEQEMIDKLEAAMKLAMEKGKLEKGVQVGRSLGEIINAPEKPMNIDLKWPAYASS